MFKLSRKKTIDFAALYDRAENFAELIPYIRRKRRRRKIFSILKTIGSGFLIVIVLVLILGASSFMNFYRAANSALSGKENLSQSVALIKDQNFKDALTYAEKGKNNFLLADSYLKIGRENIFISHLPGMEVELNNFNSLIKSAEVLSQAVTQTAKLGDEMESAVGSTKFKYADLNPAQKERVLKLIYESGPELNGLKANLDLAFYNLAEINYKWLPFPLKGRVLQFRNEINEERILLSKIMPLAQLIPAIAGYPERNTFLVILQNNDEIRPTGGFIGTYGILEMKNGDISRFDTHDIYHMDMPVQSKLSITPPEPIKEYLVDKWYMRDANWSPDWPTSAQQIIWFYQKENPLLTGANDINKFSGQFSGVIGITPKLVSGLLALTGPIKVDGTEYNYENFHDLLQYEVERDYIQAGKSSWQRKAVIGDIFKELKIKFLNQNFSSWTELADFFTKKLDRKEILVYMADEQLENAAKALNWTGEVKQVDNDYLMVVDANLGAFKTDASVSRNISYKVEQIKDKVVAKVKMNYAHKGTYDWRTSTYRNYARIFVPGGSKLIKAEIQSGNEIKDGKADIGTDLGKTFFGTFLTLDPGKIGSIYFEYELPSSVISPDGKYNLYVQRQPGNEVENLTVDLSFLNKVKSYNPAGFSVDKPNAHRIKWETDLSADKAFNVNF